MANNNPFGLLGPMPDEVRAMQEQQAHNQLIQMAQLNESGFGRYLGGSAGRSIGQGISSALGYENPAVQRAKKIQEINKRVAASGVDPSDFGSFYGKLGEELAKEGMITEASNVANAVQSYKDRQADVDTKRYAAETGRLRVEAFKNGKLKSSLAQEIFKDNNKYKPASLKAYMGSINDDNPDGDPSLLEPMVVDKGYDHQGTTASGLPVFTTKAGEVVVNTGNGHRPYNHQQDGPIKYKSGTNVSIGPTTVENTTKFPEPNAWGDKNVSALANVWQEDFKKLTESYRSVKQMAPKLSEFRSIIGTDEKPNDAFLSGTGAGWRAEAARLVATVSPDSPLGKRLAKATNSYDFMQGFVADAVLPALAQIGGNDSNEEMRKMEAALPNPSQLPGQTRRALAFIENKHKDINRRMNSFTEGRRSGRIDPLAFEPNTGEWLGSVIEKGQQPQTTVKSTTKGLQEAPPPPQQQVAPRANTNTGLPPDNIIQKYMQLKGWTREQAIEALLKAKQAKQG